jgi:hypothetical protein
MHANDYHVQQPIKAKDSSSLSKNQETSEISPHISPGRLLAYQGKQHQGKASGHTARAPVASQPPYPMC